MGLFGDVLKRSFYEGAKRTVNRDFAKASGSFEEQASMDRDVLRSRARWLHENNGIIANIDRTIVNNSVGNGMKLQVKTGDKKLNAEIEKKWNAWCEKCGCDVTGRLHFGDMQRVVLGQRMMDGEILAVERYTRDKEHPFKLQLIESDRIDSGYRMQNIGDDHFADGIILDKNGRPLKYIIRSGMFESKDISAKKIIHYYKNDNRATQYRGVSEYKQSIIDLRNFAGYQSAVIKAARVRANIGYVVETENITGHMNAFKKDDSGDPLYEINGIMVEYLNPGEKIKTLDPSVVGMDYEKFVKSSVRLIAVARNVSYELAFRDYSEVNFSSARASIIQDHTRFSHEQFHITNYFLKPVFRRWLEANVLAGNIKGLDATRYFSNKSDFTPWWIPPKREWVDPLKDIKALEKELDIGLTTLKEAAAARGKDIEDLVAERSEEIKMLKDAGIIADAMQPK